MAVNKERQLFNLASLKWRIILATSLIFSTGLVSLYIFHQLKVNSQTQAPAVTPIIKSQPLPVKVAVTALGRLQPQDKITYLSAPSFTNSFSTRTPLIELGADK